MRTVPSLPLVAKVLPLGAYCNEKVKPSWPSQEAFSVHSAVSQSRTEPSPRPTASVLPSGDRDKPRIHIECCRCSSCLSVSVFQMFTTPVESLEANDLPSCVKAIDQTASLCPSTRARRRPAL